MNSSSAGPCRRGRHGRFNEVAPQLRIVQSAVLMWADHSACGRKWQKCRPRNSRKIGHSKGSRHTRVVYRGAPVTGPPGLRLTTDTASRGSREKQPRAFDEGRRVRVLGENDILIDVCTADRLGAYLAAPNVEVKTRTDGSIKLVRLRSIGDDRGHQGECHGRSTITTERVRNDWGMLVGSNVNLKHKEMCATWRNGTEKAGE
jgi:hypothetical protein